MNDLVKKSSDLLNPEHPLHNSLVKWAHARVPDKAPTKRMARKFLAAFPMYRAKAA